MISSRDAYRSFRAAAWKTPEEVDDFVRAAAGLVDDGDFTRMLDALLDDGLRADRASHETRLSAFAAIADQRNDPQLFVPYARALASADPPLRAVLVSLLPRVNSTRGHGELCQLLGHRSKAVREAAVDVLGKVGGKVAFDALLQLARNPDFDGRIEALNVMVPKALHQSLPLVDLVISLGSEPEKDHALRLLADARYFGKEPDRAVEAAGRALKDGGDHIVALAIAVIAQIASEHVFFQYAEPLLASSRIPAIKAVVDVVWRFDWARALPVLERCLRQGPNAIRLAVVAALERKGTDEVLPLLVEALGGKQPVIVAKAVEVLGRLSDSGKVDPARVVLWLLRSRDVAVRRIAVEVVNRVGDRRGELAPKLLRFLRDEDWWVRERTMDALVEIAGPALTRHLIDYLVDPSDIVRRYAVGALKRVKDPRALPALLSVATKDADWWVREEAISAIGLMGDAQAVPMITELLTSHPDMRVVCIEALVALGARTAATPIAMLLHEDESEDVQVAAIRALGQLDARHMMPAVEACLGATAGPRAQAAAAELFEAWQLESEATTTNLSGSLDGLLAEVVEGDADDLLLLAGREPRVKRGGRIETLQGRGPIDGGRMKALIYPLLSAAQRRDVESGRDVDLSYGSVATGSRFRVNVFAQTSGLGAVFRVVRNNPLLLVLENLGLPPVLATFCDYKNGLVLVGGPTGCGKSTTLAAVIDRINRTSSRHIVSIEDPVEVLHQRDRCLITQREVGSHTASFAAALRATLREDPDVILVGELRDLETIAFAVSAAETGHLVFGTVHTASVDTSIDRLINSFPAAQQPQVRAMLADTLRAVVCQNLLRRIGGGRVLAVEVMLANDAISNLIRKGKCFQIPSVITTSRDQGMQLMDQELARLAREGIVSADDAYARALDKKSFELMLTGAQVPTAAVASGPPQRPSVAPPRSVAPPPASMAPSRSVAPPGSSAPPRSVAPPAAGAPPRSTAPPGTVGPPAGTGSVGPGGPPSPVSPTQRPPLRRG